MFSGAILPRIMLSFRILRVMRLITLIKLSAYKPLLQYICAVRCGIIIIILIFLFTDAPASNSCTDSTVRIASWNLLNFPSQNNLANDTTLRNPCYRTVMQQINPDVLVTQENTGDESISIFLNSILNANGNDYSAGSFIDGTDSDNGIFYRTSCFQFLGNVPIHTALRDINEFTLVHNSTGDTIRIYSCHLKASSGPVNEALRDAEVDSIRQVTNALPQGSDFIICGDFNFYGSYEPAYQHLLYDDSISDGNFVDPLTMPGIWNNAAYSAFHTQSPRISMFGGGAGGGMDDRFDLILFSSAVNDPGRITYNTGSLTPFGNDGLHYQDSINTPPNNAVSQNVADALYNASDHLPVFAEFTFSPPIGVDEISGIIKQLTIFPNPAEKEVWIEIDLEHAELLELEIYDGMGKRIKIVKPNFSFTGKQVLKLVSAGELNSGNYFLRVSTSSDAAMTRIFTVE